ncbi:fasciclin domain-containing protein [Tunicatimonas pelagia]|uniref:fasciclin domain-containing protein n=1 Tax=Tunicatimonas pelagia TaxID=931531 RepID=UPI0026653316|nr:fasciclin domain-containing protein [Tunicatimonas pelagia]WKN41742.1 fasciclin domain-containing protein [Tunicatimonas pelagia]
MKRIAHPTLASLILLTVLFSFSSCRRILEDIIDEIDDRDNTEVTIVELAQESPDLSILVDALKRADLVDALNERGPFTVFAPTNKAFKDLFEQLGVSGLEEIDKDVLTNVLLYHVVNLRATRATLDNGLMLETLQGQNVTVTLDDWYIFINNIKVLDTDLEASNGIVHTIEGVLLPPTTSTPAVQLSQNDTFGEILVDAEGNTLYLFTPDVNGESACTGGCVERWPVFYAEELTVGSGLNTTDFGTITREDGSPQTTYKGWPLYFFQNDTAPGDVEGDGLGDVWFVAKDYTVFLGRQEIDGEMTDYLVNEDGLTLYLFTVDSAEQSNCTGGCLDAWPPFLIDGVTVPSLLSGDDFGTTTTEEGDITMYRHRPLYFFVNDNMNRGAINGQGVNDVWFVVPPDIESL